MFARIFCTLFVVLCLTGCGLYEFVTAAGPAGEPSLASEGGAVIGAVSEELSNGNTVGAVVAGVLGLIGVGTLAWKKLRRKKGKPTDVPDVLEDLDDEDILKALEAALKIAEKFGLPAEIENLRAMIEEEKTRRGIEG